MVGLGASPTDVTVKGHVDVDNRCDKDCCLAPSNFWCTLSNLMRRVNITGGNLTLMDHCTDGRQSARGSS